MLNPFFIKKRRKRLPFVLIFSFVPLRIFCTFACKLMEQVGLFNTKPRAFSEANNHNRQTIFTILKLCQNAKDNTLGYWLPW
jgi:hypothetical protein